MARDCVGQHSAERFAVERRGDAGACRRVAGFTFGCIVFRRVDKGLKGRRHLADVVQQTGRTSRVGPADCRQMVAKRLP